MLRCHKCDILVFVEAGNFGNDSCEAPMKMTLIEDAIVVETEGKGLLVTMIGYDRAKIA